MSANRIESPAGKADGRAFDGRDVAVVGMACRFAGARDLSEYWRLTEEGGDGFGPIPADRWDAGAFFDKDPRSADKSYVDRGGFIDIRSFPAVALKVPPRRVEVMDPQQRLALELSYQAVDDLGRQAEDLPHRTGVYVGLTAVEFRTLMTARIVAQLMASGDLGEVPEDTEPIGRAVERLVAARPFMAPGILANMTAATVAQELKLHGPAFVTDSACASGLLAVSSAVTALRNRSIDMALAGGVYVCVTPEQHIGFSRVGAISPSGHCRPFDARADGFVQGDGGGMLVLRRLDDALEEGDRIYAVLRGIASNNDGGGEGPMAPVMEGQVEVVRAAWQDAGLSPARLGYLETHGTGTAVGDRIELSGLLESVGGEASEVVLGSAKANVGHTMSAAGIAGLIRVVQAIHHRRLPPMAGFESAKEDLPLEGSPFKLLTEARSWSNGNDLAGISSFGFGGTNVHAIVSPPPAEVTSASTHASAPVAAAPEDLRSRPRPRKRPGNSDTPACHLVPGDSP